MHYKLKEYILAVRSKFQARKKNLAPCKHLCALCDNKTQCAYEELRYELRGKR